jgi:hypothetical protein
MNHAREVHHPNARSSGGTFCQNYFLWTEIKLTFNQPMDRDSVESSFSFGGNESPWTTNFRGTESTDSLYLRISWRAMSVIFSISATAQSGGLIIGELRRGVQYL